MPPTRGLPPPSRRRLGSKIDDVDGIDTFMSVDDIEEKEVTWLNDPFLPFGSLVIIDGDPGQGKSLVTIGMVARAASGKPALPFGNPGLDANEAIHCGLMGAEDDISDVVKGRLRAAGYIGNRHIWTMKLPCFDKGKKKGQIVLLTFPDGTGRVRRFIKQNKLRLLIVDPVSAFIVEDINSHNEASVRRALSPLGDIARETGCCIVLVRHLNKDGSMKAMYRGGGSIAFSAIARSGIITGKCEDGSLGLAQVKCSYAERFKGVVRYSVTGWKENPGIGVVNWGEWDQSLTPEDIVGSDTRKGPEPRTQNEIRDVLGNMFAEQNTMTQDEAMAALREAGITAHENTIGKVRRSMGINACMARGKKGQASSWVWTTRDIGESDDLL
jgi:hypothetical protein